MTDEKRPHDPDHDSGGEPVEEPVDGEQASLVEESDEIDLGEDVEADDPDGDPEDAEWSEDDGDHEPVAEESQDLEEDEHDADHDPAAEAQDLDEDRTEVVAAPAGAIDPDPDDEPETDLAAEPGITEESAEPTSRRGRSLVLLAIVVVLGGLYVGGWFLTGSRMPADATVGGVQVGSMSPAAAREALEAELGPRVDDPVELVHEDTTFDLAPEDAGLALDLDESVAQAGGRRSWDPRDMVALFLGSREHAPALEVDEEALDGAVEKIADSVDVPVVQAQITFPDAEPTPREPEDGLIVPRERAVDVITSAYLVQTEPATVPTEVVEPTVDSAGLEQAMTDIAEPAVSGPVRLEVGDDELDLPVTAFAPALVVRVVDDALTPEIDPEDLAEPLTDATTGIGEKAVDATVRIRDGKPVVVPSKEGVGLEPEEMAEKLVPVLTEEGEARAVQVEAEVVQPAFTTKDAEALNITEKVSEFSTDFPYAEYRNVNQGRAAELLDGTLLKPGETFSFNDTVGERTEARGFATGTVINGGVFREELGGGVSQVVTTTYNAAFFAGLDDVEHHPHAFYIDRYPVGREATVYFGSLDLRFKNSTDHGVLISASVRPSTPGSSGRMTVQMWSTKVWDIKAGQSERRNFRKPGTQYDDTDRCVPQAPIRGFDIDIYRTFRKDGAEVKTETSTARYQAADRVICGPKPKDD